MNKSDKIRELHTKGMSTTAIAERLGIRYQFAYNVISKSFGKPAKKGTHPTTRVRKPALTTERLVKGGFKRLSRWRISGEKLDLESPLPRQPGVYAFAIDGVVQYVGVATTTLAKRCGFYIKPGPSQTTSQRLNLVLRDKLDQSHNIEIYGISVTNCAWNGWIIDGNLGLEGGLITNFDVPWNKRGASPFLG
jgi:hypothetical protein